MGGNAQTKAMKKVSGGLRLDLAAFRELEAFAQLGTDRNVLNLPAVGKSLTFRTIGITRYGRPGSRRRRGAPLLHF